MKNIFNLLFLVGIITVFNATSCNKPEPEPELPTGENTAYYYLNGQLIIPKGNYPGFGVPGIDPISLGYCTSGNSSFDITMTNKIEQLVLYFNNTINNLGSITLNESDSGWDLCNNVNNIGILSFYDPLDDLYYYTENNSGNINITYLSENKRQFKGTFEMDVYDTNGNVKHITDGHFNINVDTLND